MGDQVYAYRSAQYSSAASYEDAGRRKADSYYGSGGGGDNKVCRTVISDRDGRQQTVYGCSPTEFYDTTEASDHPRFDSPPRVLLKPPPQAHQHWRPAPAPASNLHRPQEVQEFLSGVQFEVSRRPNNQNNHASHHYGDYRSGRGYGAYSNSSDEYTDEDDDDDDNDYYDDDDDDDDDERDRHHVQMYPRPNNYGGAGRAVPVITHGVGKLSLPTNSIDEAVDYLKSGHSTNNNYKTTTVETTPKPYGESGRPYGANNSTFGMNSYGTKYDQQAFEHVKPYGTTGGNYGFGTANPSSNLEISRPSYGTKYYQPTPEPAVKPFGAVGYGKTNNNLITSTSTTTVIDCYEAARKYNGKVIRTY